MRQITHPGPLAPERADVVPCQAVAVELTLRAGLPLTQAVAEALASEGFEYGYLRLDGVALAPLVYVMPAPASPQGHAAWYSATHRLPEGVISHGGAHYGRREGRGFIHSHSRWEPLGMGHLLCDDCVIARDAVVRGWGLRGAGLVAREDAETRFTLFRPQPTGPCAPNARLVTLRPNQDIGAALQGIHAGEARIEGIGSLVGTTFQRAQSIDSHGTEILIVEGALDGQGMRLRVASVGFDGRSELDDLRPGQNAICVTAEILLLTGPGEVSMPA